MIESVLLPSKPKVIKEDEISAVYEIDSLYPGYGHTLGNSLRRIILSSLPGAAITKVKVDGANHEFSVLNGIREDVLTLLLNLKKIRIKLHGNDAQVISLKIKGIKDVKASDLDVPSQIEILNKDQYIAHIADKNVELSIEITIEKGIGYVPKESLYKEKSDVGVIFMDARFTPIVKINYEVENMRVGDRTDFNRLRFYIETDGTITPKEAFEKSIKIMIDQLKSIVGFQEDVSSEPEEVKKETSKKEKALDEEGRPSESQKDLDPEFLKTRIDSIGLSPRTIKSLGNAGIRTIGGLTRKKEADLGEIDGLGVKGIQEIKKVLGGYGISLK